MEYFDLIYACNKVHTAEQLKALQAMPLNAKVEATKIRLIEFYNHFNGAVYISFSGGKDSTVLAYIANDMLGLNIPLVFSNTGLEYSEIQKFAKSKGAEFIRPEMQFTEVISTYGYPLISKEVAEAIYYARRIRNGGAAKTIARSRNEMFGRRLMNPKKMISQNGLTGEGGVFSGDAPDKYGKKSKFNKEKWAPACHELPFKISHYCCTKMKKSPLKKFAKQSGRVPIVATMTEESRIRKQGWIRTGCNAFNDKNSKSQPMSFWTEQDVLEFIKDEGIEICSVYGDIERQENGKLKCSGCHRTGCVYCGFGAHSKDDSRFIELSKLSPKQFEYSMNGGQWVDNPDYDEFAPKYDGDWLNWNPKKIWVPSKEGLGLKFVIDEFNQLYPKNQILLP